ncbi:MAG: M23 family metallopeptidase [Chloroflexota bacterium]
MLRKVLVALGGLLILAGIAGIGLFFWYRGSSNSNESIGRFLRNPDANTDLETPAFTQCEGAPFIVPSAGFIGLLWNDDAAPYNALRRHTGIDIFGGQPEGTVPIYAAYDGWLTRLDGWFSTVIIRHDDPLQEGRTIWTYYTHMAAGNGSRSFVADAYPAGTFNVPIEQGTLIGYQGAYSPQFPVAIHLHMSIVTSEPDGSFRNEAILENTLDPSPYFGIELDAMTQRERPVRCREE